MRPPTPIELRYQIPVNQRAAVQRALRARPVQTQPMATPWPTAAAAGPWQRTSFQQKAGASELGISLETGTVHTDGGDSPVAELTLTLTRGPLEGLLRVADRWVQRHGLWLDVRGADDRAAGWLPNLPPPRVYGSAPPALSHAMHTDAALRAMVAACLQQVLPNAAVLASGRGLPEHLHQTRVGLRRLRAVLRAFGNWSGAVRPGWVPALAKLFDQLGAARDRDTLRALLPQLRDAGAPALTIPAADAEVDLPPLLRSADVNRLALQLIGFAFGPGRPDLARKGRPVRLARARLARWHRRLCAEARLFEGLGDAERHDVRKRLKRLRYAIEAVGALLPQQATAHHLARLREAQEVLGAFNDLQLAQMSFLGHAEADTHAWFALGWLAARRAQLLPQAAQVLRRLPHDPKLLRRR
jgi:CHAD domain-containing protein